MQTEAADAEEKLLNATQRLQRLEQDVMLLKDKTQNITQSTQLTNRDAEAIGKIAAEVKKVRSGSETWEGNSKEVRLDHSCARVCFFRTWTVS